MNISYVATVSYNPLRNKENEDARFLIFQKQLRALSNLICQQGDEIIISEIGTQPRYKKVVESYLSQKPLKYLFTQQEDGDETPRMGRAQLVAYDEAQGEIIINSNADILVQYNLLDAVRKYYDSHQPDVWLSMMTHHLFFDVFTQGAQIDEFIGLIQHDWMFENQIYQKNDPPLFYLMKQESQDFGYQVKHYIGPLKEQTMWDVGAPPITNIYAFPKDILKKFDYSNVFAPYHIETVLIFLFEYYGIRPHIYTEETATFHLVDSRTQLSGYFTRFTQEAKTQNTAIEQSLIHLVESYPIEFKRILAFYVRKDNGPILNTYLERPDIRVWLREFVAHDTFFREVSMKNHGFIESTDMERFQRYIQ